MTVLLALAALATLAALWGMAGCLWDARHDRSVRA